MDRAQWPRLRERLTAVFRTKTRDEWCAIMEGSDVCFAPVLTMGEAPAHPHNVARRTFVEVAERTQPAPAPRFGRTPGAIRRPPPHAGQHTDEALAEWGFGADEIRALREAKAIA
jgi:alpha-methylacyl-CoA racemase